MPTNYIFETITAAQALTYAATDTLKFQTGGISASQVSVTFAPGTVQTAESVTISTEGHTVTFATPLEGETDITFSDGSILYIGVAGNDANPRAGGTGDDAFFGNAGNDTFTGGAGDNLFQGNQGDDNLTGGSENDTVYGGQDNDTIVTGDGKNFAQGNMGNDTITGGAGIDKLYGGKGDDELHGGGGGDYINGNLGNDSIVGGVGTDTIFGEDGNDTISGGASSAGIPNGARDLITGGAGADLYIFGAGDSSPLAGQGDQILDWATEDKITFNAAAGSALNYTETTQATFADAYAAASNVIGAGTINYVAVQVGADVVIFADAPNASDGAPDVGIVLVGRTLADVDFGNIVA